MKAVYLDNAATTPVAQEVLDSMLPFFREEYGNPSSFHTFGSSLMQHVSTARSSLARLIGASEEEIFFTSGGTESDNQALRGAVKIDPERKGVVTSAVEHPAVLATARSLNEEGFPIAVAGVDGNGVLDVSSLERLVDSQTAVVSIMAANNESGVIMPIGAAAEIAHKAGAIFHTDAVQMVGKRPIDVHETGIDILSLSAHKLHGPKGIGAIYIRKGIKLPALLTGGHQEKGVRAGTYNVPGIVGLGRAAELAFEKLHENAVSVSKMREYLENRIVAACPGAFVVSKEAPNRLPGIATVIFRGVESEAVLTLLDMQGIYASSGSACSTGNKGPSHVLSAMGIDDTLANSAVRFSLSSYTTEEEIDRTVEVLAQIVDKLRKISPYAE